MAGIDARFSALFPIQEVLLDKDFGLPLSAGKVYFYSDVNQSVLKDVYKQNETAPGVFTYSVIPNPIILTSIGTMSDGSGNDIIPYLYPYTGAPTDLVQGASELYFIRVESAGGVAQFTRSGWPPVVSSSTNSGASTFQGSDNQIENPQFVDVFVPSSLTTTFSVTGTATETVIAPDWTLVTNGAGTISITQENITDILIPSGAPFALRIQGSAGVTSVKLRQRISNSPRMFANGANPVYVSANMVAKSFNPAAVNLIMDYVPSSGATINLINASTNASLTYSTLQGATATITTTNAQGGVAGYVDIVITIPSNTEVAITSLQVVTVANSTSTAEFVQESTPRQIDHLFSYYKTPIFYKPIPSYLTAWDFPLNPAQFFAVGGNPTGVPAQAVGANKSYYAWDQTILFQTANSAFTVTKSAVPAMQITAAVASSQVAMIQYLDGTKASEIILESFRSGLSVNVRMESTVAQNLTVSLWYTTGAIPDMNTYNSLVATLGTNGKPATFNGTWVEIGRGILGDATFTTAGGSLRDYAFNGWKTANEIDNQSATYFAIVVGSNAITSTNVLQVQSISLVPGSIPTIPAPQTADEVLRECQYYYESSFRSTTDIAAGSGINARSDYMAPGVSTVGGHYSLFATSFAVDFLIPKRTIVSKFNVVDLAGTQNSVTAYLWYINAGIYSVTSSPTAIGSFWSATLGNKNVVYTPVTLTPIIDVPTTQAYSGRILYQYIADARIGI